MNRLYLLFLYIYIYIIVEQRRVSQGSIYAVQSRGLLLLNIGTLCPCLEPLLTN